MAQFCFQHYNAKGTMWSKGSTVALQEQIVQRIYHRGTGKHHGDSNPKPMCENCCSFLTFMEPMHPVLYLFY
jgi:hypothetical protein